MRRGWLALVVCGPALAVAAACGSFAGTSNEAPTDGGAGEARVGEAGLGDSGGDSATSNGAPDSATSCEGGYCACAGSHTFCDDFDEPPIGNAWSKHAANGGAIDFVASTESLPTAAQTILPAFDAGPDGTAPAGYLENMTSFDGSSFTLAADVDFDTTDTVPTTDPHGIVLVRFMLDNDRLELLVDAHADRFDVQQLVRPDAGTMVTSHMVSGGATIAPGTHGRLVLSMNTKLKTCDLTWNGKAILGGPCVLDDAYAQLSDYTATAQIGGIFPRVPSTAWKVRFDNVTIDAQK
jgi:hypothetical protein